MKKHQTYLAVNLSDSHQNQNGETCTVAEIHFISAENTEAAKTLIGRIYPNEAWGVIPKRIMDKNIVTKTLELEKTT